MEKILGIDLGTNSIGWAIRDTAETDNQIIDKGVLIFNEGVAYEKGVEQPKVLVRTGARGRRRNYQAEKYRKWELIECLISNNMCPLLINELNEWRHYTKGTGRKYPQSEKFLQWLRFDFNGDGKPDFEQLGFSKHENCYLFRWLAVSDKEEHKKLFTDNPQLLGRVFYQMVQRRGFSGGDEGEAKLIEEGRKNDLTKEIEVVGIKVIERLIKEKYRTLGAALYWGQKNNELESVNNNRIRNRFTYRHYFENEVDLIFDNLALDKQPDFCKTVKRCIVWQRPLRSQKGLVGYCTLDAPLKSKTGIYYKPGKKRIAMSHPLYEEFRTWQFINNLKIEAPNGQDRLEFINEVVCPLFNRSTDFYFSNKTDKKGKETKGLKSKIEEAGGKILSNYDQGIEADDEGTRYNGNTFQNKLEKLFGEDWREQLKWDETVRGIEKTGDYLRAEDIWHLFYDAWITKRQTENVGELVFPILQKHFPSIAFDKEEFNKSPLGNNGYASLSASSIRKILPYLKQGMIYSLAVFIANLERVFDKKLDKATLTKITDSFNAITKQHKSDRDIFGIVNNLISDRLFQRDRLGMGSAYVLDNIDKSDVQGTIKETFKTKVWNKKNEEERKSIFENASALYQAFLRQPLGTGKANMFLKVYRIEEKLHELLIEQYKADPARVKKYLWHPSEQEKYPPAYVKTDLAGNVIKDQKGNEIYFLGDPNPISRGFKNPMAMKTLQVLKKHLNYLLREKIDSNTKIVVEIARDLNDANKRRAIERLQNENRKKRDKYKKLISEYFDDNEIIGSISETLLDRYELWEEQFKKCLYCGRSIECKHVLDGTAQLEHTITAKNSSDELVYLSLAHPECNAEKSKRLPSQWKERHELILKNVSFMYAKYMNLKEAFEKTYDRARTARDKSTKDSAIQERHYQKEHMNYWKRKYETFTMEDVPSHFRRQQLTDTQIITKYAIPYLKTVFKRVDVQKGAVTAKFRKIFQIEPKAEGKDRTEHSHHAIDAAVLTLIPPSSIRDNMKREFDEAVDNNTMNSYEHPKPKNWDNFHQSYILSFKDEIIINHLSEDRTLKQSFKYQRKRGKFVPFRDKSNQVVFETDGNGHFIYHTDKAGNIIYKINDLGEFILDEKGNRIPVKKVKRILQAGITARGQLHDESIFGMVKMPETEFKEGKHKLKITDGKLTFKKNEKRKDELFVVKKIKITDIKNIDDFEGIVIDPNLGYYLKKEVARRMSEKNLSFEDALLNEPFYAFGKEKDKNGNQLQPIRHLRCKMIWTAPPQIKKVENAFESKYPHKKWTYVP